MLFHHHHEGGHIFFIALAWFLSVTMVLLVRYKLVRFIATGGGGGAKNRMSTTTTPRTSTSLSKSLRPGMFLLPRQQGGRESIFKNNLQDPDEDDEEDDETSSLVCCGFHVPWVVLSTIFILMGCAFLTQGLAMTAIQIEESDTMESMSLSRSSIFASWFPFLFWGVIFLIASFFCYIEPLTMDLERPQTLQRRATSSSSVVSAASQHQTPHRHSIFRRTYQFALVTALCMIPSCILLGEYHYQLILAHDMFNYHGPMYVIGWHIALQEDQKGDNDDDDEEDSSRIYQGQPIVSFGGPWACPSSSTNTPATYCEYVFVENGSDCIFSNASTAEECARDMYPKTFILENDHILNSQATNGRHQPHEEDEADPSSTRTPDIDTLLWGQDILVYRQKEEDVKDGIPHQRRRRASLLSFGQGPEEEKKKNDDPNNDLHNDKTTSLSSRHKNQNVNPDVKHETTSLLSHVNPEVKTTTLLSHANPEHTTTLLSHANPEVKTTTLLSHANPEQNNKANTLHMIHEKSSLWSNVNREENNNNNNNNNNFDPEAHHPFLLSSSNPEQNNNKGTTTTTNNNSLLSSVNRKSPQQHHYDTPPLTSSSSHLFYGNCQTCEVLLTEAAVETKLHVLQYIHIIGMLLGLLGLGLYIILFVVWMKYPPRSLRDDKKKNGNGETRSTSRGRSSPLSSDHSPQWDGDYPEIPDVVNKNKEGGEGVWDNLLSTDPVRFSFMVPRGPPAAARPPKDDDGDSKRTKSPKRGDKRSSEILPAGWDKNDVSYPPMRTSDRVEEGDDVEYEEVSLMSERSNNQRASVVLGVAGEDDTNNRYTMFGGGGGIVGGSRPRANDDQQGTQDKKRRSRSMDGFRTDGQAFRFF